MSDDPTKAGPPPIVFQAIGVAVVFLFAKPVFADIEEVVGSFVVAIVLGALGLGLGFALQAGYRRFRRH